MSPRTRPLTADEALLLTADTEPYLSCDDCFEQVDQRMDALLSDHPEPLTPEFRTHLNGCAACRDEAWSLLELAGQDLGVSRETLTLRFDRALRGPSSGPRDSG